MFRKSYTEANDSIKPDEAFVRSVLQKAKRKKPPAYARYRKYAVSAAAAVVIVSAAVIAMPVWRGVVDKSDGVIVEETVTETADKAQSASPKPAATPDTTEKPKERDTSENGAAENTSPKSSAAPSKASSAAAATAKPSHSTSNHSSGAAGGASTSVSAPTDAPASETAADTKVADEAAVGDTNTAQGGSAESGSPKLKSVVEDNSDYAPPEDSEQEVYMKSAAKADNSDFESARSGSAIPDTSLPTPSGYYCTRAEWNGYTFVNDDGAVIIVSISYGGEDSGPYYSQDGENIYAGFTAYGMTVSVSASGADMATVEEIINSLR